MMQEKDAKGAAEEMKRILVTGFEPFGRCRRKFPAADW